MARKQQVRTIDESIAGEEGHRGGMYLDDALPLEHAGRDMIAGQLAVWRIIGPEWEEFVVGDLAHAALQLRFLRRIILSEPASSEPRQASPEGLALAELVEDGDLGRW